MRTIATVASLLSLAALPIRSEAGFFDRCPDLFKGAARPQAKVAEQLEFAIPKSQIEQAMRQVDHKLLNETYFVIPNNDGEAVRAVEILKALEAPHLNATRHPWGVKLDTLYPTPEQIQESFIEPLKRNGVKRVTLFELPAPNLEEALRKNGFEVTIIDHHKYGDIDRRKDLSSLEQLMALIHWPMSRVDEAIAVNDRSYIPGMRKMGLSDDEIRQVRAYDQMGQGKSAKELKFQAETAKKIIPHLPERSGIKILDLPPGVDVSFIREELAIRAGDRVESSIDINPGKIGFSGDPKVVDAFHDIDLEALGYSPQELKNRYSVGDRNHSMLFGFKPKTPPKGYTELIPKFVQDAFWKAAEKAHAGSANAAGDEARSLGKETLAVSRSAAQNTTFDSEVKASGMMPRGSAVITSAGNLEKQGIRHIIHAASGSMTQGGAKFDPSVDGVVNSVKNALKLAQDHGHKRVAVPFIGGKIFVDRIGISAQELANHIVDAALESRNGLELRFVTFGEEDTRLFQNALKRHAGKVPAGAAEVTPGSITDYKIHGATAIINAANMEVMFGGGLSGAIGRASGASEQIDREAQKAIQDFYKAHPEAGH